MSADVACCAPPRLTRFRSDTPAPKVAIVAGKLRLAAAPLLWAIFATFRRVRAGLGFSPWTVFQVFHPPRRRVRWWPVLPLLLVAVPALAKDDLGVFGQWAAFRDPKVPRCYAITSAEQVTRSSSAKRGSAESTAYADVATWPKRGVRGQVHFRLARTLNASPRLSLAIGGRRFELTGGGVDAWAKDPRGDAAIVAAMRSAPRMTLSAVDSAGRRFSERYSLEGVATALDAATVGCARMK